MPNFRQLKKIFVVANGSDLGSIPVVRKEDECLGLVDGLKRVNGICRTIVHTPDFLGARRGCLCAMSRDWSLL